MLWPKLSDVSPVIEAKHRDEVKHSQIVKQRTGSGSAIDMTV